MIRRNEKTWCWAWLDTPDEPTFEELNAALNGEGRYGKCQSGVFPTRREALKAAQSAKGKV